MSRQVGLEIESWEFSKKDTLFRVTVWKKSNHFDINYSLEPGSSSNYLSGNYTKNGKDWVLISDSLKLKIEGNNLIRFGKKNDTIGMLKIER